MDIKFSLDAWEEYLAWQKQDKRTLKRINDLLRDIMRGGGFEGMGKPEPLKGNLAGFWNRRIDERHRLVYRVEGDTCLVVQCRGHYGEGGRLPETSVAQR